MLACGAATAIGAALAGVAPAAADPGAAPPRRIEVGAFLGLDYFGDDIELGNSWAAEQVPGTAALLGGRVGLIALPDLMRSSALDPQLGVEGELKLAFASTGNATEGGRASYFAPVIGWRVHALARLRHGGLLVPHLVAGVGGETVLTSSPFMETDTDPAFYWGPGVTWKLSGRLQARADLRHALAAGRADDVVSTIELHFGLATGWDLAAGATPAAAPRPRDSDGDGFPDLEDACPAEPETENGFKDDDGCPDVADRDGDGILDPADDCPDEPETVNRIDDDDGCPEHDPDGDGLIGSKDACEIEAEDFDHFQDEDGCPDRDNDGDGRPDISDVCPDQAEVYNGFDDEDGCPDELPKVVKQSTGAIEGITFEVGRARIQPRSRKVLQKAAGILREFASIRIRVEGHTDDRGSRERNLELSLKRADAVKWYLIDQGIAADRIETVGHGPDLPRAPNKTVKGRAQNRRIEFHVIFQDPTLVPATQPTAPAPATQPAAPVPATQPTTPAKAPQPPTP